MVDNAVLSRKQLERLTRRIEEKTLAEKAIPQKKIGDKKENKS
jgi:hypothetical protein